MDTSDRRFPQLQLGPPTREVVGNTCPTRPRVQNGGRGRCGRPHARRCAREAVMTLNVTPLAYSKAQASEALGMSLDSFERHVQADLKVVRRGRLVLVPVRELERW